MLKFEKKPTANTFVNDYLPNHWPYQFRLLQVPDNDGVVVCVEEGLPFGVSRQDQRLPPLGSRESPEGQLVGVVSCGVRHPTWQIWHELYYLLLADLLVISFFHSSDAMSQPEKSVKSKNNSSRITFGKTPPFLSAAR